MTQDTQCYDLDMPLIEFPEKNYPPSYFTIRDAVEGLQIFGGIGSGKTSGSGRMFALKYLQAGFGGLVLTVKPDEKEVWEEYCRLTGRSDDLIVLEPGGSHKFNFLEYESSNTDGLTSITENIVQVLKTVIRASEEKSTGKSDDRFWEVALDMLMFHVIDLCQLAYGKASVQQIYDIVMTAPNRSKVQENEQEQEKKAFTKAYRKAQINVMQLFEAWKDGHSQEELDQWEADGSFDARMQRDIPEARLLAFVDEFFAETYRNLSDKTRSIIDFSFSGFLFRLLKEPFYSLFCNQQSTCKPEDCLKGKIILLNLPVKIFDKVGRDSQIMFKYIWQRAMERRRVSENSCPVFLWADEAQNFLHEHDADYQATARSSRIATVYLSQNLPNYYANMGGEKPEPRVKSFLGTLATKIFHANADIDTNHYSSNLVGEAYMEDPSVSTTMSGTFSTSRGLSYKLEKIMRPEEFVSLKTGGPRNNFQTEAIIHKQGNTFSNGFNYKRIRFNQQFAP